MTQSNPAGAEAETLAAAAEAWLPTSDPVARARIFVILQQVASTGADPIAELRDGLHHWFGPRGAVATPPRTRRPGDRVNAGFILEPLYTLRRPTLWPQRPKRLPDELFSSWLWRAAVAAGAPPRQFAKEAIGPGCDDADRDVPLTTLRRLAQVTGQTVGHLAGGLLQPMPEAVHDTSSSLAESVVLLDDRFLLTRSGSDRRGRANPVLQFCPRCLQTDARPYFRRAWRMAHVAVCLEHGCPLHDRCWRCDKQVVPLAQRSIDAIPRCLRCEAVLAEAPSSSSRAGRRQAALHELLLYLAIHIPAHQRTPHLEALRRRFGRVLCGWVAEREAVVAGLFPASVELWFGSPADPRHAEKLQMLAEGAGSASLAVAARQKKLRARRALNAQRAIYEDDLEQDAGRKRALPGYSETARTLTWTMIEGQRERMAESARQGVQSADQNR